MTNSASGQQPAIRLRQVFAVALGNGIEFYDFLLYAFFAIQIGKAFFPAHDTRSSLLAALATFGAGFLTRPLGAVVLGGLADRVGRKPMMLISFGLIGVAGLGMALTPSYAAIGAAAPAIVIALRLIQGFALGGEVGASTAFLIEASPPAQRGYYVSLQFVGQNAAALAAGLVGLALSALIGEAALAQWGWRIAFLIGVAIVPIGLVLRHTLPETLHAETAAEPMPALKSYARVAILALVMLTAGTIATYVMNYMTTYAAATLHMPSTLAFGATIAVGMCGTIFTPFAGRLSDRYGRKPLMLIPAAILMIAIWPAFWMIGHFRAGWALYTASAILRTAIAFSQAAILVSITESLPARVRSGGLAVLYAVAISIFGGSTQFMIAWLIGVTGDPLMPAWYLLGSGAIGFVAMLLTHESAPAAVAKPAGWSSQ